MSAAAQEILDTRYNPRDEARDRRSTENGRRHADRQFAELGRSVVAILDKSTKWNAETLAAIVNAALRCGVVSEKQAPLYAAALEARKSK